MRGELTGLSPVRCSKCVSLSICVSLQVHLSPKVNCERDYHLQGVVSVYLQVYVYVVTPTPSPIRRTVRWDVYL